MGAVSTANGAWASVSRAHHHARRRPVDRERRRFERLQRLGWKGHLVTVKTAPTAGMHDLWERSRLRIMLGLRSIELAIVHLSDPLVGKRCRFECRLRLDWKGHLFAVKTAPTGGVHDLWERSRPRIALGLRSVELIIIHFGDPLTRNSGVSKFSYSWLGDAGRPDHSGSSPGSRFRGPPRPPSCRRRRTASGR